MRFTAKSLISHFTAYVDLYKLIARYYLPAGTDRFSTFTAFKFIIIKIFHVNTLISPLLTYLTTVVLYCVKQFYHD